MRKKLFSFLLVIILTTHSVVAQEKSANACAAFKTLIGCWQGTLNYSGTIIRKPYTTAAELVVQQIGKSGNFRFLHIYTKDPNDNVADTTAISKDGKKLNKETIKSKRYTNDGNIEIIAEALGFDHDNDKAALVRQIYTIGKDIYTYKKQVQLKGETEWLDREEFNYVRKSCRN